jgi:hypothetical protein
VLLASMDLSDRQTLLMVSAGDQPPFWPSYRMSRQMWPLLQQHNNTQHSMQTNKMSNDEMMCSWRGIRSITQRSMPNKTQHEAQR